MEIILDTRELAKIDADALVTYVFDQEKPTEGSLARLDYATGGALSKLAACCELTGKFLEPTLLYYPQGLSAHRLLILGAGKKSKFGTAEIRGGFAGTAFCVPEFPPLQAKKHRVPGARRRPRYRRPASHHRRPDPGEFLSPTKTRPTRRTATKSRPRR